MCKAYAGVQARPALLVCDQETGRRASGLTARRSQGGADHKFLPGTVSVPTGDLR